METPKDWVLTRRYGCPSCGKRYVVAEWKHNPKCRQCGAELRSDDSSGKPSQAAQAKGMKTAGSEA